MRRRRTAAFERRQQLYRMENEEGYEEGELVDGLPQEEDEAEMTDRSDTEEEEEEEDSGRGKRKRDWVSIVIRRGEKKGLGLEK